MEHRIHCEHAILFRGGRVQLGKASIPTEDGEEITFLGVSSEGEDDIEIRVFRRHEAESIDGDEIEKS